MAPFTSSNSPIITRPLSGPPRLCDPTFLHLHLHTPYSLLDGGSSIQELVHMASRLGMDALACTDHNSLAASVKFVERCRKFGIKPILGAELTMEDDSHLTLLCRNTKGYANLSALISLAWDQGERLIAHLPWESLNGLAGDLICLSGCRKGRIPTLVREGRMEEAKREAERLRDLFGPEGFYLELQEDYLPQSWSTNRALVELGRETGIPVVATNNVHYARPEDAIAHDVLRCIATKTTVEEIAEGRPLNDQRYLKSAREMAELFHWRPEAIENTVRIAEMCEPALPEWEDVTPHYDWRGGPIVASMRCRSLIRRSSGDVQTI